MYKSSINWEKEDKTIMMGKGESMAALFNRHRKNYINHSDQKTNQINPDLKLSKSLQTNLDNINNLLEKPEDLKIRQLRLGENNICAFIYIEGTIDAPTFLHGVISSIEQAKNLP